MSADLPNTMAGLRLALRDGVLSRAQALQMQVDRFRRIGNLTRAVTRYLSPLASLEGELDPLSGVALAHKDLFDLHNCLPGLGRQAPSTHKGLAQAAVLNLLDGASAANLGTLALAEDACSATGQSDSLPTPVNPLGMDVAVGGSSSGSAVAVASGMVYASLGTDTAGSVRIPAMTCGVMGLKTTHGLIDRQGMTLLCPSLDSIGVLARAVDDIRCVMRVLARALDWDNQAPAKTLRVGHWLAQTELDDDVRRVVDPVMRCYGHRHIDMAQHERRASALQELVMAYEVGQTHRLRIAQGKACPQVAGLGGFGLTIPPAWWGQALRDRAHYLQVFVADVFKDVDVLLAPLQTGLLPRTTEVYLGQAGFKSAKLLGLHRYCGWINYLGLPSLSIPVGLGPDGLPISIQLVGKPFHEPQLLAVGEQIQNDIHGGQGIMPVLNIREQQP